MEKHLTATVYIVSKIKGILKVLLHKHKKYDVWLGVGGHVEKDENPYESALREAEEETGVKIKLFINTRKMKPTLDVSEMPQPFMIKEEKIPKYGSQRAHYHIDFIYFGTTKTPKKISMSEEFNWFSKEEIKKLDLWEDVKFVALAAFKNYTKYKKIKNE